MAGYSGTPLAKKLAIKAAQRVAVLGAPGGFEIPDLPDGVEVTDESSELWDDPAALNPSPRQ